MYRWLSALMVGLALAAPAWGLEEFRPTKLHTVAAVVGDGTLVDVTRYSAIGVDLTVSGTASVAFEGRLDVTTPWRSVRCLNLATGVIDVTAAASGSYHCAVAGLGEFRARLATCASCVLTAVARTTTATPALVSGGGTGGGGGGGDGAILDGVSATLKASVFDYTNSNPLATRLVDGNGDAVSVGGGTQYSEDTASADAEQLTMAGVARQDVPAGTTSADGDRTVLKSDSVGRLWVNGSGVTQPVSGTVTVTDGAGALNVIVDSAALPTGATTLAEQQTQTTALQLIDNLPLTQGAATSGQSGVLVQGAVTTAAPTYTTGNTNPLSLQTDGALRAAVTNTPAVTQSGTWNIGSITTLPALATGANTIGGVNLTQYTPVSGRLPVDGSGVTQPVSLATNQPVGTVAHDGVDSGNPLKVGCHARTTSRTAVADADRADVVCDKQGKLVTTLTAPRERVVRSGVVTVSTTAETTLIAAGGAGVFRDLTYLKCTNSSATLVRVDLRDVTAGTVIDSWTLAASGGGFNLAWPVPYNQATANGNWTIQLSAAVTDVRCAAQAVENN